MSVDADGFLKLLLWVQILKTGGLANLAQKRDFPYLWVCVSFRLAPSSAEWKSDANLYPKKIKGKCIISGVQALVKIINPCFGIIFFSL